MAAPVSTSTTPRAGAIDSTSPNRRQGSRIEILIDEFCDRGLDPIAAEDLANDLIANHPMARIFGIGTLSHDIAARGMAPEASREIATVLLGIELLDRGADYRSVVEHLKRQPILASEALAAALEASRIHRLAKPPTPMKSSAFFAYLAAGVTAVSFAMILVTVLSNFSR